VRRSEPLILSALDFGYTLPANAQFRPSSTDFLPLDFRAAASSCLYF